MEPLTEGQAVADYNGTYVYGCGPSINNSIANYYDSTHPDGATILAVLVPMVTVCATWQAMYGSGQTVSILVSIAFSAAAAGAATASTVLSRTGSATTRAT